MKIFYFLFLIAFISCSNTKDLKKKRFASTNEFLEYLNKKNLKKRKLASVTRPVVLDKEKTRPLPPSKKKLSLQISPYFTSRVNKTKDISYGGAFSREQGKHEFFLTYSRNSYESTDPLAGFTIKSAEHKGIITYDINKVWGPFTYFFMFEYAREQEGEIFIKYYEARTGPLGIKYDLIEDDTTDISISFIPLYEILKEEVEDDLRSTDFDTVYKKVSSNNIRNSFRLKAKQSFFKKKLAFKNVLFWRPIYKLKEKKWDFSDSDFENTFKMTYQIENYLAFSYSNKITWSRRLRAVHRLPPTDMENKWELELSHSF